MNDLTWFKWYQPQLLGLANTSEGRDLLGIDHGVPTVVEIAPWYVTWLIGQGEYQSEFHSKAVYFRRVLHRWNNIVTAMEHPSFTRQEPVFYKGKQLPVIAGGTTTTVYPDANTETSSVDGYIGYQGLGTPLAWAIVHGNSGSGTNTLYDYTSTMNATNFQRSGNWEDFTRAFLLFDTSAIGGDTVSAAVFSFVTTQTGSTADDDTWTLVSSAPASNTALASGDYDSCGTTSFGTIESTITAHASNYHDITLNAAGRAAVDGSGITKYGFRSEADRADSEPSDATTGTQIIMLTAETSGTSKDPKLVVTHAAPPISIVTIIRSRIEG